ATCCTIAPGEALRLSIAAAAFPAYPVNPGTGAASIDTPRHAARIITLGLATGAGTGSVLRLGAGL
ncbi:MAG TPA: hypothetical protein VFF94_00410, partial [Novosphingobium sp.]|nr:hypothetical protein [Novosphingobium sp.]